MPPNTRGDDADADLFFSNNGRSNIARDEAFNLDAPSVLTVMSPEGNINGYVTQYPDGADVAVLRRNWTDPAADDVDPHDRGWGQNFAVVTTMSHPDAVPVANGGIGSKRTLAIYPSRHDGEDCFIFVYSFGRDRGSTQGLDWRLTPYGRYYVRRVHFTTANVDIKQWRDFYTSPDWSTVTANKVHRSELRLFGVVCSDGTPFMFWSRWIDPFSSFTTSADDQGHVVKYPNASIYSYSLEYSWSEEGVFQALGYDFIVGMDADGNAGYEHTLTGLLHQQPPEEGGHDRFWLHGETYPSDVAPYWQHKTLVFSEYRPGELDSITFHFLGGIRFPMGQDGYPADFNTQAWGRDRVVVFEDDSDQIQSFTYDPTANLYGGTHDLQARNLRRTVWNLKDVLAANDLIPAGYTIDQVEATSGLSVAQGEGYTAIRVPLSRASDGGPLGTVLALVTPAEDGFTVLAEFTDLDATFLPSEQPGPGGALYAPYLDRIGLIEGQLYAYSEGGGWWPGIGVVKLPTFTLDALAGGNDIKFGDL